MVQKENNIPWEVRIILPCAAWVDRHPRISNALLWVMCAACFWAALTYNFTTHI